MKVLTSEELQRYQACGRGVAWFERHFPDGFDILELKHLRKLKKLMLASVGTAGHESAWAFRYGRRYRERTPGFVRWALASCIDERLLGDAPGGQEKLARLNILRHNSRNMTAIEYIEGCFAILEKGAKGKKEAQVTRVQWEDSHRAAARRVVAPLMPGSEQQERADAIADFLEVSGWVPNGVTAEQATRRIREYVLDTES